MSAIFTRNDRALRHATDPALSPARRVLLLLSAMLAAVILAMGVASPASAAGNGKGGGGGGKPSASTSYAALGDSYAAGQGAGSYLNTTCYVSSKGYPALIDADRKITLTARPACSGASTSEVIGSQVGQIATTTTRVTLTAGGNDVGFGAVVEDCFVLVSQTDCQAAIDAGNALVASGELAARITATVAAIKARAPQAVVIVTGYPRLFEPTVTRAHAQDVNAGTTALNAAIRDGAVAAGARFVDVETAFAGHGIGSSSPWINDWSWLNVSAGFHPNASGYVAYANQVKLAW
ncbi:SGNH/GDSL hydrolase family protein [Microbacterium sp. NPDC089321]|uniref:SGNH/GDSL hydrolase family protein n=1 Tax=Microbacterium sp. NPDC089321 TaxID=3155183 RepID=UPI00344633CE